MRHLAFVTVGVMLLAACAATPPSPSSDNFVGKTFSKPPTGSLIVLLPTQQTRDLDAGENLMSTQLRKQLERAGYRVATLDRANYTQLWSQEVASVGGIFDQVTGAPKPQAHGIALSELARKVCAEAKCALLIQQRLIARQAKMNGAAAEWDGQRRSIPLKNDGGANYNFSGTTVGLSVELYALTSDGQLAFRTYGGATLPFETDVRESKNKLRPNLFRNDEEIAEAVHLAVEPLTVK